MSKGKDAAPRPEDLAAISDGQRKIPLWSYIAMWWSSLIVVQAFAVGYFGVYPHGTLNVKQAVIASALSAVALAILFSLNCIPGYKRGVPYALQARSSFGVHGAKIATIIRSLPALAWYGIGNWIGALTINIITQKLWGFGNVWVYFIIFMIVQTLLAMRGITVIQWFNTIAAIILAVLMAITLVEVFRAGTVKASESVTHAGSWGAPFWGVFAAGVAAVITGALNASDVARHMKKSKGGGNNWVGHLLGIAPPWLYMMVVGIIFGLATGNPDPVASMMEVAPTAMIGIAMLVFVLGAQVSTNLTLNILPPTHAMQDISKKISWSLGVIISGAISVATLPWLLFTNKNFFAFLGFYAMFLGPILGIILADYWVVSKRKVDVKNLYDDSKGSKYWFSGGFSFAAIIALVAGVGASIPFMSISWIIGMPVGFVVYIILKVLFRMEYKEPAETAG
jgi:nucleobase:cation symporter-1, NCS1 family